MIIYTAKLNKKRILAVGLAVLILILSAFLFFRRSDDAPSTQTLASGTENLKTNEQRIAYIASLGYTVDTEPSTVKEVIIPSEFDDTYKVYNDMQKQCGFDLEKYMGKRAMHYVYAVSGEQINVELLLVRDKVIGGSIFSVAADGFMQGLAPKK